MSNAVLGCELEEDHVTLSAPEDLSKPLQWPAGGVTRVPYRIYTDPEIYALEQSCIYRGPIWNFLCLELEIANPGDFKTSTVGDTPVVVTRDEGGDIHAMINRCSHKGALVCLKERGNAKSLTCVYHSWVYDMQGRLKGLAFHKGLNGKGGMPEDFDVAEHRMESEPYVLPDQCVAAIVAAKANQGRVIGVGTTVVRTLEHAARASDGIENAAGAGNANIFIYPGFGFHVVDAMLTNFHLPRSTPILMAAAFAGRERLLQAYEFAVRQRFRFYSYGDAMLIT